MRSYWLRILLGALAVFAIGMIGVTLVRRGRDKVGGGRHGLRAADHPAAVRALPARAATSSGTIDRLVVNREAPKKVSSIELRGEARRLAGRPGSGRLPAGGQPRERLHASRRRRQHSREPAGREARSSSAPRAIRDSMEFGTVVLIPGDVTRAAARARIARRAAPERRTGSDDDDSTADALAERADRSPTAAQEMADSAAERRASSDAAVAIAHSKLGDSLRAEGKRRADSLHKALGRDGGLGEAALASETMLLVLDNYDSFTYNLVQYAGELGAEPVVYRNDALSVDGGAGARARRPSSSRPGPARRAKPASACRWSRAAAAAGVPLLGVCLGHQAIGEAFGGQVVRADRLMHGKTTMVAHTGHPRVRGAALAVRGDALPLAGRGARAALPGELEVTAWSADRAPGSEIMGLCHRSCRSTASSSIPSRWAPATGSESWRISFAAMVGARVDGRRRDPSGHA